MAMKWFLALTLVGIALVAAALLIADRTFTTPIHETGFVREAARATLPPRRTSTLFVPMTVSLAALEDAVNAAVPPRFTGQKTDFTNLLKGDRITWHVDRGPIRVTGDGRLRFAVAANGQAHASGVIDVVLAKKEVGATALVESALQLSGQPHVLEDWRVRANLAGDVVVRRADIPIKHLGTVSVRDEVRRVLDREKARWISQLEQRIATDRSLRREAEAAWRKLFLTRQLLKQPAVWLRVRPTVARLTQARIGRDAIHVGVGFDFVSELIYADKEPDNPVTPLPNARIGPFKRGALDATVVAALPWAALSTEITDKVRDTSIPVAGGGDVRPTRVTLSPTGESILMEVDLSARHSWLDRAEGRVSLIAKPVLDADGTRLSLQDLRYAIAGGAAVKAIAWLYESDMLRQLERLATVDLSPWLAAARSDAQETATQLVDRLPAGVSAKIDVQRLTADAILPTKDSLLLAFTVQAALDASVTAIDLPKR